MGRPFGAPLFVKGFASCDPVTLLIKWSLFAAITVNNIDHGLVTMDPPDIARHVLRRRETRA